MFRRALLSAAVVAALACSKTPGKKGPVVARGNGIVVTADELKTRIDEQSPMIRNSFQSLERKKQFLDNLIRFELLASEAEREGFAKDPDVLFTMKKVMVSKYYQKHFQDQEGAKSVPEDEIKKYFDEHQKEEFHRPTRVHAVALFLKADQGSPARAQKLSEAKRTLARVLGEEKKDVNALSRAARESSDDAATKAMGGDLGFKTQEEYEKAYGKDLAGLVFKLPDMQTSQTILETPQGFYLVRVVGRQPEMNRTFDEVKGQIAAKLYGQKRTKEFDDTLKRLRDKAHVQIFDSELEKVQVAAAPTGGAMGPHGAMGAMGGGMGGRGGGVTVTGPAAAKPAPAAPATPATGHPVAPAPAAH